MITIYEHNNKELFKDEESAYEIEDIRVHYAQFDKTLVTATYTVIPPEKEGEPRKVIFAKKTGTKGVTVFRYANQELLRDETDQVSVESVREQFMYLWPGLDRALVEKSNEGGMHVVTFRKICGTKGVPDPNPELTEAVVRRLVLSEDYDDEQIQEILEHDEIQSGDWPAWISTAERLPELEAGVLFCVQFEAEQFMCFGCMDRIDRDESDDYKWFSDLGDEFEPEDVTHWMAMPPFPPVLPEPAAPEGPGYAVRKFTYNGFSGKTQRGFAPYRALFVEWTTDPGVAVFDCSDGQRRLIPTFAIVDFDRTQYPAQSKSGVLFGQAAHS